MTSRERALELDRKKQQLNDIRRRRQQQEEEKRRLHQNNAAVQNGGEVLARYTTEDMDRILQSVGIDVSSSAALDRNGGSAAPNQNDHSSNSSTSADLNSRNGRNVPRPSNLELTVVNAISIAPRNEHISYCKTTQTDEETRYRGEFSLGSAEMDYDEFSMDEDVQINLPPANFDESPTREIRKHLNALQFNHHAQQNHQDVGTAAGNVPTKVPDLSEEERRQILNSHDFNRFFQQTTRVIERALAEDADIFMDYINGPVHEDKQDKGEMLVFNREFSQGKTTENRFVKALDFSTFYPELLAVAYDRNSDTPLAPEGVVNVWNTRFKTPPEITFHCSSRVTSMIFDSFQSNIIIGGCYSGQICIWDTRANKKNPVCRTQLSSNAHTQPIMCMKMVGSQNAHDLITVSTDGRLCSWSVDNLQQPIESIPLMCKSKRQITALSMSFFHSNINSFVIGSEEKVLHVGDRHGNKGEMTRSIEAHDMPVTAVDLHHAPGSVDFSPLCLSGSLDFTVKLWHLKDASTSNLQPLLNFERKHKLYIVDVQWSPVHPAVFVSASTDGVLNLWNLNANTEQPIATLTVSNSITKLLWSKNGQQLGVADNNGRVFLYDVHESLYNVRATEWDDFADTLSELKLAASGDVYTDTL